MGLYLGLAAAGLIVAAIGVAAGALCVSLSPSLIAQKGAQNGEWREYGGDLGAKFFRREFFQCFLVCFCHWFRVVMVAIWVVMPRLEP